MGVVTKFKNKNGSGVTVKEYISLGTGSKLLSTAPSGNVVIPIFGCKDPAATNYDPTATHDSGACTYPAPVLGCTNPAATNYNPLATQDNGTCTFAPVPTGILMFSEEYKQEMIKRWKKTGTGGKNFNTTGDVAPFSPGDVTRIKSSAAKFVTKWKANPGFLVYDGKDLVTVPAASNSTTPNPSGVVQTDQELHPDQMAVAEMHMAAFTYWIDPTSAGQSAIKDYIKTYLIAQTSQPWWDFGNTTRWVPGVVKDLPPGYYNAQIICMMLGAMEFVGFEKFDGYDTPNDLTTEFGKIKRWFIDAAVYYAADVNSSLDNLFSVSTVRNGDFSQYVPSTTADDYTANPPLHRFKDDPYFNRKPANFYNNRRGDIIMAVAHVGYVFNHAPSILAGTAYYKELLAFYTLNDLLPGELERATVTSSIKGGKGWQYIANTYNQAAMIAWFDYRAGGNLIDTVVNFGLNEGNDPTVFKTLPKLMATFCELRLRTRTIYCRDDTTNTNPIRPDIPDAYNAYQDVGFVVVEQMCNPVTYATELAKIKAAAYSFPGPLPSAVGGTARAVDGNGTYSVHNGPGGTLVACMLCWGYMNGIPAR